MTTGVTTYNDVIKTHAARAVFLYKNRLAELQQVSGLTIGPDGNNTARTKEDVLRYLKAIEVVGGPVAVVSARLVMKKAAMEAHLEANF